jgi:hypothetical protein
MRHVVGQAVLYLHLLAPWIWPRRAARIEV